MKRRTDRAKKRADKNAAKRAGQLRPGGKSRYAKKNTWCRSNSKWGFEVVNPKPWK